MANMVMLELFIEEFCQIAVKQEGFIVNSQNRFKLCSTIIMLNRESRNLRYLYKLNHLTSKPYLSIKVPYSHWRFYSLKGHINPH